MTIRPIHPADLDAVLAIAAASPQAPRWPPSAWDPYLAPTTISAETTGAPHLAGFARCGSDDSSGAPQVSGAPHLAAMARCEKDDSTSTLLRAAFVSTGGSAIFGFAAATLLLDGQDNRAELDSMAVHPGARRRGLGSGLLRAVFDWAAAHGACRLSLEVRASNAPALSLYSRFGFLPEGRRPRYYSDPEEDALLLGTPVTPVFTPP